MKAITMTLNHATKLNLINLVFFQAVWFLTVIGAAQNLPWLGLVGLMIFAVSHHYTSPTAKTDFQLAAIAILIGIVIETFVVQTELLNYTYNLPSNELAPAWILILWANLALTLNGCLAWLQEKYTLAGILGAVGASASYYGGIKLGAATTDFPIYVPLLAIALVYALITPLLLFIARQLTTNTENAA
jgi:hypothetical protein